MAEDSECAICCDALDDADRCRIEISGTSQRDGDRDVSVHHWSAKVCRNCYDYLADESAAVYVFRVGMKNR